MVVPTRLLVVAALLVASAPPAVASPSSPRVSVELLSDSRAIAPGGTFWVGLRQTIAPGWHTRPTCT